MATSRYCGRDVVIEYVQRGELVVVLLPLDRVRVLVAATQLRCVSFEVPPTQTKKSRVRQNLFTYRAEGGRQLAASFASTLAVALSSFPRVERGPLGLARAARNSDLFRVSWRYSSRCFDVRLSLS